jgi:hypothetical protein
MSSINENQDKPSNPESLSKILKISSEDDVSSFEKLEQFFENADPDYITELLQAHEHSAAKA